MANQNPFADPLKNWLKNLERESWHLELLISGFSIFLLVSALQPVEEKINYIGIHTSSSGFTVGVLISFILSMISTTLYFLILNLIIHVFLRGLWIGCVGLRSVSPSINYKYLGFIPKFEKKIKNSVGDYDQFLVKLDNVCSLIFSFSFLVTFVFISLSIFLAVIVGAAFGIQYFMTQKSFDLYFMFLIFVLAFIMIGVIYAVDFFSFGAIKKSEAIGKYYYPIYRFMSGLTLSFLYRPIYYSFISTPFSRKFALLIIPYFILFWAVNSIFFQTHQFLPLGSSEYHALSTYYENERSDNRVRYASIPSRIWNENILPLFVPYTPSKDDKMLSHVCPDLKPMRKTGMLFKAIHYESPYRNFLQPTQMENVIQCFDTLIQIKLNDSIIRQPEALFGYHPETLELGLHYYINLDSIHLGKNVLKVSKLKSGKILKIDSVIYRDIAIIPFFYNQNYGNH